MHYYVIVGTYSTDQNAEKFIASAKKKNDQLEYAKIRFRGYGRNRGESDEERGVRPVPGCVGFQIQIRTIASGAKTKTACSFRKEQAVFVLASGVYSPK